MKKRKNNDIQTFKSVKDAKDEAVQLSLLHYSACEFLRIFFVRGLKIVRSPHKVMEKCSGARRIRSFNVAVGMRVIGEGKKFSPAGNAKL